MLSIHHISVMMWIFYIHWQQYWKCDWRLNIGANRNAHGKRTVSTKQPQVTDLTVGLPDIGGTELVFKSLDCFTVRPIFSTRLITRMKSFFLFVCFFGGGRGAQLQGITIWCCIPISRPPRVFRRFKRRSCWNHLLTLVLFFFIPATRCWNSLPALMNWAPCNGS